MAGLADDLGIPGVICLGQEIAIRELIAEAEAPVGLRTARQQIPQHCCSAAAPPDFPRLSSTRNGRLAAAVRCIQDLWPTRTDDEAFLPIAPFTHVYGFCDGRARSAVRRRRNGDPGAVPAGAYRRVRSRATA